jgi:hypothetical protein
LPLKSANAGYVVFAQNLGTRSPPRLKKQFFYPFLLLILIQFEISKLLAASRRSQLAWFRNGDFIKIYKIISFPFHEKG